MTRYIDANRDRFGVEPICQTLQVAPSTYYAVKSRRPASRRVRDEELKRDVSRVHRDNFGVYGVEKIWRQLLREGIAVGSGSGGPTDARSRIGWSSAGQESPHHRAR